MFQYLNLCSYYFISAMNECTRLGIKQNIHLKPGWASKFQQPSNPMYGALNVVKDSEENLKN